jgi:hypothetical protein
MVSETNVKIWKESSRITYKECIFDDTWKMLKKKGEKDYGSDMNNELRM